MEKYIFKILLFLIVNSTTAQSGLVKYKLSYQGDDTQYYYNLFYKKDVTFYEIDMDSISNRVKSQLELPIFDEPRWVYTNFYKKELIFRDPVPIQFYTIKDSLLKLEWHITNEYKKIGDFNCIKAITTFRKVNYIAWFSPDIPIPFGPWKINGLSGLILEIYTENYRFHVEAVKINTTYENVKKWNYIDTLLSNRKKMISLDEYKKLLKTKDRLIERHYESMFPRGTFFGVSSSDPLVLEKFDE